MSYYAGSMTFTFIDFNKFQQLKFGALFSLKLCTWLHFAESQRTESNQRYFLLIYSPNLLVGQCLGYLGQRVTSSISYNVVETHYIL